MSEALAFIKVTDEALAQTVALLAQEIWAEYYIPIIGKPQVEYMLKVFQSKEAIMRQLRDEGFLYYLIKCDNAYIGYAGFFAVSSEATLFLSKLYVRESERGKGYGRRAVSFIENEAREMDLAKIRLTVNKNNTDSIKAYLAIGFRNIGPIIQDIGSGFFMDDYLMEKAL